MDKINITIEITPVVYNEERNIVRQLIASAGVSDERYRVDLFWNQKSILDCLDYILSDEFEALHD